MVVVGYELRFAFGFRSGFTIAYVFWSECRFGTKIGFGLGCGTVGLLDLGLGSVGGFAFSYRTADGKTSGLHCVTGN